jgi:hypothetical protein
MKSTVLIVASTLAIPAAAYGNPILNVEIGPPGIHYSGTAAAPDAGTIWNHAVIPQFPGSATLNLTGLLYSNGTAASGLSITSSVPVSSYSDGQGRDSGFLESRIFTTAGPDGGPSEGRSNPFDLLISGLSPNKTYTLYAYGSNFFQPGGSPDYSTMFTVGATSDYALGIENAPPFTHHDSYALLTDLTTNSGTLTIQLGYYNGSTAAVISGLQLASESSAVPEPSGFTLLIMGALVGLGYASAAGVHSLWSAG